MWRFRNKHNLPGIRIGKGDIVFNFTEEEQKEIERAFEMFKDYKVHPDFADTLQNGGTARALSFYAHTQAMDAEFEDEEKEKEKLFEKALAASIKAYSTYQLPIYLYDTAFYMSKIGEDEAAKYMFEKFLNKQAEYKPNDFDDILMQDYDVDNAIEEAKKEITK